VTFWIISANIFSQKQLPPRSLPELLDSIDGVVKREHIAGLMLGMVTKDSVLFSGGFGYADIASGRKVTGQTHFRMGSVTKMFVSMAIMKLIEERKLLLDTKLAEVAPEVPFQNPWEKKHPVRIVHLLEHTSGFDDIMLGNMYSFDTASASGLSMATLHRRSLICRWKPGERSAYSNPNYAILGYVIEKITHKKYDEYLRDAILQPIGMSESNFNNHGTLPQKDTKEYMVDHDRTIEVPHVTLLTGPQGALWSCADDMIKFIRVFLKDGRPIITPRAMQEIETAHSSLPAQKGLTTGYALANRNCFIHQRIPFRGHDGLAGTCYSGCYYNRDLGVGFVIASNSNKPNYKIENLIVTYLERNQSDKKMPAEKLDEKNIEPFEGWYQFDSPRNEIAGFIDRLKNLQRVYHENGKLYAKPIFEDRIKLYQTGDLTFAYDGTSLPMILFTRNDDGEKIMCGGGGYYRKVSGISAIGKRFAAGCVLLILLSSFIAAVISIILLIRERQHFTASIIQCLPAVGMISFILAAHQLFYIKDNSYLLASLNTVSSQSITIFIGTSMFGLCSILYAAHTGYRILCLKTRPLPYRVVLSTACITATVFLWHHGWIGLRTWAP